MTRRNRSRLAAAASAAGITLALAGTAGTGAHAAEGLAGFTPLAVHPEAAAQPETSYGDFLTDLTLTDDGLLHMGYGDYTANSGPVVVNPLDTSTWQFLGPRTTMAGEAILAFTELSDGSLVAPNIDPRTGWSQATGFASDRSGTWVEERHVPFIHVYDVVGRVPGELWMVGSANVPGTTTNEFGGATVYRSTDDGATWELMLQEKESDSSRVSGMERYYWIAALDGKVVMQATSLDDARVHVHDGTSWSSGELGKRWTGGWSSLDRTRHLCRAYDGSDVVQPDTSTAMCFGPISRSLVTLGDGRATRYDGGWPGSESTGGTSWMVQDWFVADDGWTYAMAGGAGIARTDDAGATWEIVREGRIENSSTLAVVDDRIIIGGAGGQLWRSDATVTQMVAAAGRTVHPVEVHTETLPGSNGGRNNGQGPGSNNGQGPGSNNGRGQG